MTAAEIGGFLFTMPIIVQGLVTGMAYGLLAVGLVLVYRSNKVINFAHGEIGAFGAAVFGVAVVQWGVPYWVALPFALVASAGIGGLAEVAVVRRLRSAPRLMSLVATLGVAQLLLFLSQVINQSAQSGDNFPQPSGFPTFRVGTFLLTQAYTGLLFLSPIVVVMLILFFRLSRFGLAIRASAGNPEAARMAGVFAARMSSLSWAIAGALAGLTAILLKPTLGFVPAETLGPTLLLPALAAAVVARMERMPVALITGMIIGVIELVFTRSFPTSGGTQVVLFGLILAALLFQSRGGGRADERGNWGAVQPWAPLSGAQLRSPVVRRLGVAFGAGALVSLALLALVVSNQTATTLTFIIATAIVGLSLGIVTGLAGQLSLGQFAIAGVGAAVSYQVTSRTGSFANGDLFGFVYAGIAGAIVSVLLGLPALRIRGLLLAVTTLSFAIAAETYVLQRPWLLGGGVFPTRPTIAGTTLDSGIKYYLFAVAVFALALLLARNVWRSGLGRRMRAIRDNEDGARAFGIGVSRVKLEAFAIGGFIAGLGGAVYGHTLSSLKSLTFAVGANINLVAMSVIGGISVLSGPVLGALYILGIPAFVQLSSAALAASSFGWLILILYFPGGLAQLLSPIRERIVALAAGFAPGEVLAAVADSDEPTRPSVADGNMALSSPPATKISAVSSTNGHHRRGVDLSHRRKPDVRLLEAQGLNKHFGGVHAVNDVDIHVVRGETLGLIGPNGAGKTTLFEILGGFTRPDTGWITFDGYRISRIAPERRAQLGLVRSFQDAALFPTLTVLETVQLAGERQDPTRTIPSLLGSKAADRAKERQARELIALMGLNAFIDKQIGALSTGTRRITELACIIALEPTLVLLDEPASGVAQRETEALGELLARMKQHLDATLIVIEHDMPLIMSIADRIVAMDSGSVIATGTPAEIVADDLVLESYLGGAGVAIERSGPATPHARSRRTPLVAGSRHAP